MSKIDLKLIQYISQNGYWTKMRRNSKVRNVQKNILSNKCSSHEETSLNFLYGRLWRFMPEA